MRNDVRQCAERLQFVAGMAELAAKGPEPKAGAEFLLDVLHELEPRLRRMKRAVGKTRQA
jgi:hypothetical protein